MSILRQPWNPRRQSVELKQTDDDDDDDDDVDDDVVVVVVVAVVVTAMFIMIRMTRYSQNRNVHSTCVFF